MKNSKIANKNKLEKKIYKELNLLPYWSFVTIFDYISSIFFISLISFQNRMKETFKKIYQHIKEGFNSRTTLSSFYQ